MARRSISTPSLTTIGGCLDPGDAGATSGGRSACGESRFPPEPHPDFDAVFDRKHPIFKDSPFRPGAASSATLSRAGPLRTRSAPRISPCSDLISAERHNAARCVCVRAPSIGDDVADSFRRRPPFPEGWARRRTQVKAMKETRLDASRNPSGEPSDSPAGGHVNAQAACRSVTTPCPAVPLRGFRREPAALRSPWK